MDLRRLGHEILVLEPKVIARRGASESKQLAKARYVNQRNARLAVKRPPPERPGDTGDVVTPPLPPMVPAPPEGAGLGKLYQRTVEGRPGGGPSGPRGLSVYTALRLQASRGLTVGLVLACAPWVFVRSACCVRKATRQPRGGPLRWTSRLSRPLILFSGSVEATKARGRLRRRRGSV